MKHNAGLATYAYAVSRAAAQLSKQPRAGMFTADEIAADAIKTVNATLEFQAGQVLRLPRILRRVADKYDAELHVLPFPGSRAVAFRFRNGTWSSGPRNLFRII